MTPDLAEALALLGDAAARCELLEAVERFHAAEALRHAGPRLAARLAAIAAASAIVAEASGDADLLDMLCPVHGHLPTQDAEALAAAGGIELECETVSHFATLARLAHQRLDAAMNGPSARWRLLMALARIWQDRGHLLGSGPDGKWHRFARAVGDAAGVEITHHAIRQVCERHREMQARPHTAAARVAA